MGVLKLSDASSGRLVEVFSSLQGEGLRVGERQISGQFKDAFATARSAGTLGPILDRLFSAALHAAKRVHTETELGVGAVSVASAAVVLAEKVLGRLAGARITEIPIQNIERPAGTSNYGISRTFGVFLDLILLWFLVRYTDKPMRAFGKVAMVCFASCAAKAFAALI